jgi:hypothetical protein
MYAMTVSEPKKRLPSLVISPVSSGAFTHNRTAIDTCQLIRDFYGLFDVCDGKQGASFSPLAAVADGTVFGTASALAYACCSSF